MKGKEEIRLTGWTVLLSSGTSYAQDNFIMTKKKPDEKGIRLASFYASKCFVKSGITDRSRLLFPGPASRCNQYQAPRTGSGQPPALLPPKPSLCLLLFDTVQ